MRSGGEQTPGQPEPEPEPEPPEPNKIKSEGGNIFLIITIIGPGPISMRAAQPSSYLTATTHITHITSQHTFSKPAGTGSTNRRVLRLVVSSHDSVQSDTNTLNHRQQASTPNGRVPRRLDTASHCQCASCEESRNDYNPPQPYNQHTALGRNKTTNSG